jgi:hypothetical protein
VTDCPGPPCVFISKLIRKYPRKSPAQAQVLSKLSAQPTWGYTSKKRQVLAHTHTEDENRFSCFSSCHSAVAIWAISRAKGFFLYRWLKIDSLIAAAAAAAVRHTHTRSMGSRVYRRSGVVWPCWNGTSSCCRPTNQSSCINSIALLFFFFPPMTHREYKPSCPDWSPCGVAGRHLICGRGGSYRLDAGQIPDNKKKPAGLFPTKTLFVFSKNTRIIISNVFI